MSEWNILLLWKNGTIGNPEHSSLYNNYDQQPELELASPGNNEYKSKWATDLNPQTSEISVGNHFPHGIVACASTHGRWLPTLESSDVAKNIRRGLMFLATSDDSLSLMAGGALVSTMVWLPGCYGGGGGHVFVIPFSCRYPFNSLNITVSLQTPISHYSCMIQFSTLSVLGIHFSRQNLTSVDVRLWRLKSIPALKGLKYF